MHGLISQVVGRVYTLYIDLLTQNVSMFEKISLEVLVKRVS